MSDNVKQKLIDSEESYLNTTFWDVHPMYLMIQNGDEKKLREILHFHLDRFPAGRITKDERKQLEYLTVSLVNTFMIAAIQGGVYPPDANAVADNALRRLSQIRLVTEIPALVSDAALQLCRMVRSSNLQDTGNIHVEKAKHYLTDHLTQEIHMKDIADAVGISPYHLCRIFKSATGMTLQQYLIYERIEAAKELLVLGDRSIPQISSLLRFCDQSYFTKVFREQTGITPGQYRNQNKR